MEILKQWNQFSIKNQVHFQTPDSLLMHIVHIHRYDDFHFLWRKLNKITISIIFRKHLRNLSRKLIHLTDSQLTGSVLCRLKICETHFRTETVTDEITCQRFSSCLCETRDNGKVSQWNQKMRRLNDLITPSKLKSWKEKQFNSFYFSIFIILSFHVERIQRCATRGRKEAAKGKSIHIKICGSYWR